MSDQQETKAERIHRRLDVLRDTPGLKELHYTRAEGFRVEYVDRPSTDRRTVQAAEETARELGDLIDRVAAVISHGHLERSLRYRGMGRLALESSEQALFEDVFGIPLEIFRKCLRNLAPRDDSLAREMGRALERAESKLPQALEAAWRDTAREIAPLGFRLEDEASPWGKTLRPTPPDEAGPLGQQRVQEKSGIAGE